MRIISGKFKGRKLLETSHLKALRPTTDRNREALFNILFSAKSLREINFSFDDTIILDLCCGTGAVGFEAISRGAKFAIFVDKNPAHLEITKQNAKNIDIENQVEFFLQDANFFSYEKQFDFVYVDPPYADNASSLVKNLVAKNLIHKNSLIVVENNENAATFDDALKIIDCRKYGESYFWFLMPKTIKLTMDCRAAQSNSQ